MLRTGRQYLDALADDRSVWLDGERVAHVPSHPAFARMAATVAELYDLQHEPDLTGKLSFEEDGERFAAAYRQPRSHADLAHRRIALERRARVHGGMLGRAPDFMNVYMASLGAAADNYAAGGAHYADNARAYYRHARAGDLCLTHTLAHPQRDRSTVAPTGDDAENAARIVGETDAGFIVRGARMLATLAPFCDEIAVLPSGSRHLPDSEEAKPFAFACVIPVATPGLKMICRTSLTPVGARLPDYPLSARMDEMDCVVVFDDVLVPWERTFIYRNPRITVSAVSSGGGGHMGTQTAIKDLVKTEFLLGIAYRLAEATNVVQFPNVTNMLAEMITLAELTRGAIHGAEALAAPGPGGTLVPGADVLRAQRNLYAERFPRLLEIVQTIGAGGLMMTPSVREREGPVGAEVDAYFQAAALNADDRIRLFSLARDAAMSGFSGRQTLYERYFQGDPWRLNAATGANYARRGEVSRAVDTFLARTRELDEARVAA